MAGILGRGSGIMAGKFSVKIVRLCENGRPIKHVTLERGISMMKILSIIQRHPLEKKKRFIKVVMSWNSKNNKHRR
jgi:hypothetical protein